MLGQKVAVNKKNSGNSIISTDSIKESTVQENGGKIEEAVRLSKDELYQVLGTADKEYAFQRINDLVNTDSMIWQRSISPSKQYQLWIIYANLLIFSNTEIWFVYHSELFCEGELAIRDIKWDEEISSVSFTLFYIVYGESSKHVFSFTTQHFDKERTELEAHTNSNINCKKNTPYII